MDSPSSSNITEAGATTITPGWSFLSWLAPLLPMLNNPYIQESIRFLLLGSVLETGRRVWQWLLDRFTSGFFVTAHFSQGDWAYDWLNEFLAAQEIWTNSREYRVTASNLEKEWTFLPGVSASTEKATAPKATMGAGDGNPRPLYFPASDMPQVMRWKGHWIQITRKTGTLTFNGQFEQNASLSVTVYTRKKKVLDDLVEEARLHYLQTSKPPLAAQPEKSSLVMRAQFMQGDWTYDWLLDFLDNQNAWQDSYEVIVTAKSAEKKWGMNLGGQERDEKMRAYYQPISSHAHLWCWNKTWMQIVRTQGSKDYRTGREEGGSIQLKLFTGRKQVLDELVAAAAAQYYETSKARVTVHLAETYGDWGPIMTKQIRPMDSIILPAGVTDMLVDDLKEFLNSKDWYAAAGIPWRRGVLLWGEPGTGKSSTVHAIAGELQLEIYFLTLAGDSLDDSTLHRLVSATPPNCIILIEDIDCAFPSRTEDVDDSELINGRQFDPYSMGNAKSNVTLSGLLNLLDSVASEEGRIVFATTNHIDRLDPAILRPGRMDLRIEYKLATRPQTRELFKRFFSQDLMAKSKPVQPAPSDDAQPEPVSPPSNDLPDEKRSVKEKIILSDDVAALFKRSSSPQSTHQTTIPSAATIDELAELFSETIPESRFSIAQLQGYLLSKKRDPRAAVAEVDGWLAEREEERLALEAKRTKRLEEKRKWERAESRRARKEKREAEEEERLAEEEEEKERKEAEEKLAGEKEKDGEVMTVKEEKSSGSSSVTSEPVVVDL